MPEQIRTVLLQRLGVAGTCGVGSISAGRTAIFPNARIRHPSLTAPALAPEPRRG